MLKLYSFLDGRIKSTPQLSTPEDEKDGRTITNWYSNTTGVRPHYMRPLPNSRPYKVENRWDKSCPLPILFSTFVLLVPYL